MAAPTTAPDTSSTASTTRTATSLLVATRGTSKPKLKPGIGSSSGRRFSPSRRLAQEEKKIESTRQGQLRALERL